MCDRVGLLRLGARLACVFPLLSILAVSAATPAISADQSAKLKSDKRLAAQVDLAIAGEPLPLLCEQLAEATGAKIWADVQVALEKVAVFCKKRPAWEVMAHVADLFGYRWGIEKREGEKRKYKLFQDSQSIAKDREVKMAYLKQGWDVCWEKISETSELWSQYKDDPEAFEMAQKVHLDIQNEARSYNAVTPEEWRVLGTLRYPRMGMFAAFIRSLPQPKLDMLLEGKHLVFSTYFADPEWRLDAELADEIARVPIDRFPPSPDAESGMPAAPQGRFVGAVVSLRFCPVQPGRRFLRDTGLYGGFCARYEGGTISDWGSPSLGSMRSHEWTVPSSEELEALATEFPWLQERITVELPEEEKTSDRAKEYWLPGLLQILHDAAGIPIISDAYWTKGRSKLLEMRNTRLGDYLERLCYSDMYIPGIDAYRWTPQDDWLHMRCGVYPIARMAELPADLVERLRTIQRKGEDLGLPELAEIAELDDWQRTALKAGLTPEGVERMPYRLEEHLDSLRICGKVKPALVRGDDFRLVLRYPEMTADQQRTFVDHLAGPKAALWPGLSDLPNCTFEVSCRVTHTFLNNPEDWPRASLDDFELFVWNGEDRKGAEAAYQQFIKENPGLPKTKLHHFQPKKMAFTYRIGDEVVDTSTLRLSRKELRDEEQEAGAHG